MKRSILLGIVGIASAMATSSYGQGFIQLGNYISSLNIPSPIKWGPGTGGTAGTPVNTTGFTVDLYYAAGSVVGSVASDPSGTADPTTLYASFILGTGTGSSAPLAGNNVFNNPGAYASSGTFQPGLGAGAACTVMLVAFNGANYDASTIRGHSGAFLMTTSTGTAVPQMTGVQETDGGFQVLNVTAVPEPTTMALGGLGLAALMLARRKKA